MVPRRKVPKMTPKIRELYKWMWWNFASTASCRKITFQRQLLQNIPLSTSHQHHQSICRYICTMEYWCMWHHVCRLTTLNKHNFGYQLPNSPRKPHCVCLCVCVHVRMYECAMYTVRDRHRFSFEYKFQSIFEEKTKIGMEVRERERAGASDRQNSHEWNNPVQFRWKHHEWVINHHLLQIGMAEQYACMGKWYSIGVYTIHSAFTYMYISLYINVQYVHVHGFDYFRLILSE